MKYLWSILVSVLVCLSIGFSASLFQAEALEGWYLFLDKPSITPPDFIFPIAWGIIYVCMGISFGIAWHLPPDSFNKLLWPFAVQLILNFTWSITFFTMQSPYLGFLNIALLDFFVVLYVVRAFKIDKGVAALFTPYILWLLLATYLNGYIAVMN